jgi:tetratricopeptide (TPR) repeat protein
MVKVFHHLLVFIILLWAGLHPFMLNAQVKPLSKSSSTYAVVIGISDYQDAAIPDLRFAHKDAEAFANYLRSPAGGSLDEDHLKVLTNDQATAGRIAEALDGLVEQVREGDLVIIYFSGHGDVERKTVSQPGFLLAWDAPSRVYMGGGTYSLSFLQEIVTTLSTQNMAKVTVITDACHAGKLSGNQIGGAQLTSANLAKQYANEVKILSCQPNEFSLEGEQWGGGRGCFSYHLIEGLYGLADRNEDDIVTVGELDRYLEDNVTSEAAPQSQVPMLLGNKTEPVASVSVEILAELKKAKSEYMPVFASIDGRGFEDNILAKLDSIIVLKYAAFKKAVAEKRFFPDSTAVSPLPSADELYLSLSTEPGLVPLNGIMKRNYAAALQDDAQQAINRYMKAEVHELSLSPKTKTTRYQDFPRQLARAAELVGPNHYLYRTLKARQAYFEGFPLIHGGEFTQDMLKEAGEKFHEALFWEPDMPLALLGMIWFQGFGMAVADSTEYYAQKAIVNSPTWILPYVRLSQAYSSIFYDFDKSKEYLDLASRIDSTSPLYWEAEGSYYYYQQRYDEAEAVLEKIIVTASTANCLPCSQDMLTQIYLQVGRLDDALEIAQRMVVADSSNSHSHVALGTVYTKMGKYTEAERAFRVASNLSALQTDPESNFMYWKAYIYINQNEIEKAFESFEQSIILGYDDYIWMQVDVDMARLREKTDTWKALMKKYFPDQVKAQE